jgi:hypothetical protein
MQDVKDASGLYEVERRATYAARPGFRILQPLLCRLGPADQIGG